MEIKLNQPLVPLTRTSGPVPAKTSPKPGTDNASFDRAESLDRALANTADVRQERVSRARKLVADPAYPPTEAIRKIADLIASNLDLK